jgi:DNA-binding transcriptional LysR family regulator
LNCILVAIRLDLRPSGTLDVVHRLDRGDLDLTVGSMDSPGERFATAPLFEGPFVMVMRRGHPGSRRKLAPSRRCPISRSHRAARIPALSIAGLPSAGWYAASG